MDDLISRQLAIVQISEIIWDDAVVHDVKEILKELPSAQPQPVVICKDCKYWMRENVSDGYCSEMNIGDCDEDFYCGYAVRKDNR